MKYKDFIAQTAARIVADQVADMNPDALTDERNGELEPNYTIKNLVGDAVIIAKELARELENDFADERRISFHKMGDNEPFFDSYSIPDDCRW